MYESLERWIAWFLTLAGVIAAAVWLTSAARFVDGVDMYVFVNHARDMVRGLAPESDSAYRYFPGVYTFWRGILCCFGFGVGSIGTAVVVLLGVNALLTGLLSWRLTQSRQAGGFAGLLYLSISSRYECLSGTAEPLATVPFLLAVLCLSAEPTKGRSWMVMLAGVGLGLCVYCKQQAGLLAPGVIWIPISAAFLSRRWTEFRRACADVILMALVAPLTLLLAVLCEGQGLTPVMTGLQMAAGYETHGSWSENLYSLLRNDETTGLMALIGAGGFFVATFSRRNTSRRDLTPAGVLACAGLAALVQFCTRGYYHYFLLIVPCLVTVFVWAMHSFACVADTLNRPHQLLKAAMAVVLIIPVLRTGDRPYDFEIQDPFLTTVPGSVRPWHFAADVRANLEQLRRHVSPHSQILVMPPVRSVIYLLLDGRQPAGYAFGRSSLDHIDWDQLEAAVVLDSHMLDDREAANWKEASCDSAMLTLRSHGFELQDQAGRFLLLRRNSVLKSD